MRRILMLGGMLLLVLGAAGCGNSQRDEEISKAINHFSSASDQLKGVKDALTKAVKKLDDELAAKTRTDDKLNLNDLKPALAENDKLREVGKKLVEVKAQLERLKDKTDQAEREELAKQYRGKFDEVVVRLNKVQSELDTTLAMVQQRSDKTAYDALRDALKTSREEFEGLSKQR